MSQSAQPRRQVWNGNGSTTAFAIPFDFQSNTAYVGAILYDSSGVPTTWTYGVDYTISGSTLNAVVAPASGKKLAVYSKVPYSQADTYSDQNPFLPSSMMVSIDKLEQQIQQVAEAADRAVKLDRSATSSGPDMAATLVANATLCVDSGGTKIIMGDSIASVSANAAAASASATSAASSAATATTQATNAATSATAAAASATSAAASATAAASAVLGFQDTSSSSVAIGTGAKTFTVSAGKLFAVGQELMIASAANVANYMHGQVTGYSGTTLNVTVTDIGGSGTKADWVISVSGTQGPTGATGATGSTGATGAGVPTGGSTGQVLKKNSNADYDTVWGAAALSTGSGYQKGDGSGGFTNQAAPIPVADGGTGKTSFTTKSVPYYDGTILNEDTIYLKFDTTTKTFSTGGVESVNYGDTLDGNLVLWGQGKGANSKWYIYDSPTGDLTFYNPNQAVYAFSMRATGGMTVGTYALSNADQLLGLKNNAGETAKNTLVLEAIGSQTGDYIRGLASGRGSSPFKVTIAGKGYFTGMDAGSARINNVQDPSSAQDAATKAYVDTVAAGAGATAMAVLTKTSGYTVTTSDFSGYRLMLVVNFSSAATITLPAASNSGYVLMIKNIGSAPATIAAAGSDVIDGDASYVFTQQYQAAEFISDGGTSWNVF